MKMIKKKCNQGPVVVVERENKIQIECVFHCGTSVPLVQLDIATILCLIGAEKFRKDGIFNRWTLKTPQEFWIFQRHSLQMTPNVSKSLFRDKMEQKCLVAAEMNTIHKTVYSFTHSFELNSFYNFIIIYKLNWYMKLNIIYLSQSI